MMSPSEMIQDHCELMTSVTQGINWHKVPVVGIYEYM